MFSGATLNLSLWILLTTKTPEEGKKAWQGKVKSWPWHVQILKAVAHMCGRWCLAITEAKLSSTGDREVDSLGSKTGIVTPCFWETWYLTSCSKPPLCHLCNGVDFLGLA